MINYELNGRKLYFASDLHLGLPDYAQSLQREKHFVRWLDTIKTDAAAVFLLGDIFDFWYEWKRVAPQGFIRFLGKICELTDSGIPVHYFTGNHDIWVFDYLPRETGMLLHRKRLEIEANGKRLFLAHGDGLGPNDLTFKLIKKVFTCRTAQWLFSRFHPNFAIGLAYKWSRHSRYVKPVPHFKGIDKEWLILYALRKIQTQPYDYLVFGHRHIPAKIRISAQSTYINTGDWLHHYSYAVFDGNTMDVKLFHPNPNADISIIRSSV